MKTYSIIVETRTHHKYQIQALSLDEALKDFLSNMDHTCLDSYPADWPEGQEPEIVSIIELK